MAIITLPSQFSFTAINKFGLERASNMFRSRFTGKRSVVIYPFAMWRFEGTLVEYDGVNAAKIRSFLAQLQGQANTFRLPVPGYSAPTTGYAGTCRTNGGAAARATSIAVDGMPANTAILNEGDYINLGNTPDELKVVTAPVASNASGQATITFEPFLRVAMGDNQSVKLLNPTVLLCMEDDDAAMWGLSPPYRHKIKISATEAI